MRIMFFGDSNTWGYDPETSLRFTNRYTQLIQSELNDDVIIEEGLNGRTLCQNDPYDPDRNGCLDIKRCIKSHLPLDVETLLQIIRIPLQDLITTILMDEDMQTNHPKVVGMLNAYDDKKGEAWEDIQLTLRQDLRIFDTDTIKYQFDENPNKASPMDLTNGISIFLALPDHLLKQYSPVFRLITQMVLNYLSSIPEHERAEKDVPMIWLLIDEFGSIGKLQIQEPLARLRSRKVSIWLACQGLSQLDLTYGHDGTRTILDNTETTLVFSCKDKPTAEIISSWCGQYQETKISKNKKNTSMFGDQSLTTSSEHRNVMDISDIMALRKNKELLVFDEGNRYLIKKCPYWQIPLLKEKSDEIKKINEQEG